MNSGGSNGDTGPGFHRDIKDQIQVLADEIAILGAIPDADPGKASAVRVIGAHQRTIRRLRSFLPGVPVPGRVPEGGAG